jgi:hypothetical protein
VYVCVHVGRRCRVELVSGFMLMCVCLCTYRSEVCCSGVRRRSVDLCLCICVCVCVCVCVHIGPRHAAQEGGEDVWVYVCICVFVYI